MENNKTGSVLRPFCTVCGWRKGGTDSWDGVACKCGKTAGPLPHDSEGNAVAGEAAS